MRKYMILAGVVTALLFSALIYIVMGEDRTAPVITQDNKNMTYTEGEDLNFLLSGVKARDDVDGDVTSSVIVGDVVAMADKTAAKVTYLAKDSSNNVGELEVLVPYAQTTQTAEGKADSMKAGGIKAEGAKAEGIKTEGVKTGGMKAEDIKTEGMKAEDIKTEDIKTEGLQDGAPVIVLTAKEAEVKVRGKFHPEEYIKDIKDDKDSVEALLKNITVTGEYDLNKQGTYVLLFTAKDSDGNQSEEVPLILKVTP